MIREALLAAFGPIDVEMLLGVSATTSLNLVKRGVAVPVYVPFGVDWFPTECAALAESRGA
ncbi:MAG: hypothetical protein M3O70_25660 [Actinomycetota bacterium]|nr:hypothetical protein [Actinomycetota bacterium]